MFEQLFQCETTVQRYRAGPLVHSRLRYLEHRATQGYARSSLQGTANEQLSLARFLDAGEGDSVCLSQIEASADRWVEEFPERRRSMLRWRRQLVAAAVRWLDFTGQLQQSPVQAVPHGTRLEEFAASQSGDRGLSEATVKLRCKAHARIPAPVRRPGVRVDRHPGHRACARQRSRAWLRPEHRRALRECVASVLPTRRGTRLASTRSGCVDCVTPRDRRRASARRASLGRCAAADRRRLRPATRRPTRPRHPALARRLWPALGRSTPAAARRHRLGGGNAACAPPQAGTDPLLPTD